MPKNNDTAEWESLHKTLALHISELLNLLRGDEAV